MIKMLYHDEAGFLISAEFAVIITLMFCGVAVGFAVIRDSMVAELHDVSEAIGSVNQTYNVTGIRKSRGEGDEAPVHGRAAGFGFNDNGDACDCDGIVFTVPTIKIDPAGQSGGGQAEGI